MLMGLHDLWQKFTGSIGSVNLHRGWWLIALLFVLAVVVWAIGFRDTTTPVSLYPMV